MKFRYTGCHSLSLLILTACFATLVHANEKVAPKAITEDEAKTSQLPLDEISEPTQRAVLSFKAWKSEKVQEAINEIVKLRRQVAIEVQKENQANKEKPKKASGKDQKEPVSAELHAQLHQAKISLDAVRELSVTDYFILYLSKQEKKTEAFLEAARQLDETEVAELLRAYDSSIRDFGDSKDVLQLGLGDSDAKEKLN